MLLIQSTKLMPRSKHNVFPDLKLSNCLKKYITMLNNYSYSTNDIQWNPFWRPTLLHQKSGLSRRVTDLSSGVEINIYMYTYKI